MATKKELKSMPVEELEKYIQALDEDKQKIREEQLKAHAILDSKNAEEAADRILENMSEAEMEALTQRLSASGIEGKGEAGTPGD